MRTLIIGVVGLALASATFGQLWAARIQWADNGHYYEAVSLGASNISWDDASVAAGAVGGYLVTTTSAEENDFVLALVDSPEFWTVSVGGGYNIGPWIGGFQYPPTPSVAENWQWTTGEDWDFTNWYPGSPDDSNGDQDKLHFLGLGNQRTSKWNDLANYDIATAIPVAYVIEYVPEPSTLVLLAIGALGLLVVARRKRR